MTEAQIKYLTFLYDVRTAAQNDPFIANRNKVEEAVAKVAGKSGINLQPFETLEAETIYLVWKGIPYE